MNFKELKIGYVPHSEDLTRPGDRRRFVSFAKKFDIDFEIADANKDYDIILVTVNANLSKWIDYKIKNPRVKLIFEMADSAIFSNDLYRDFFKGVGRYILGKESEFYLDYKKPIFILLKIADAIICSSTEIKSIVSKWNKNVFVSLDYFQDEILHRKKEYKIEGKIKLVWEGQGVVLENLLYYKNLFSKINLECDLHIITDEYYNVFGNFLERPISKIINQLPINCVFHKWEKYKNFEILSQCDIGIIPLNPKNKMAWHKPANKLISFWYVGIPTIVSSTPAYVELMNNSGVDLFCSSENDWISKFFYLKNMSSQERQFLSQKNLDFVSNNFSFEQLNKSWYDIFECVLLQKDKIFH